jgi:hypothetical protein
MSLILIVEKVFIVAQIFSSSLNIDTWSVLSRTWSLFARNRGHGLFFRVRTDRTAQSRGPRSLFQPWRHIETWNVTSATSSFYARNRRHRSFFQLRIEDMWRFRGDIKPLCSEMRIRFVFNSEEPRTCSVLPIVAGHRHMARFIRDIKPFR